MIYWLKGAKEHQKGLAKIRINGLSRLDESSYKTLCGYINYFRNVNQWFKNKPWNKLTEKEILESEGKSEWGFRFYTAGSSCCGPS